MRNAKWRIVTAVLLCFALVWSCVDGFVPSGTAFAAGDAEATPTKYDAAGWQITLKDAAKGTSMKEIGASLDFSEAASAAQDKRPTAGSVYYVLEMSFENVSSEETIDWESDVYLEDSAAKQYSRIDDDFLTDYGMTQLSDAPLESGSKEGWICFDVPETVDELTLVVAFDAETLEIPVDIEEDEPEAESATETVTEGPTGSATEAQ
ncbi:MAG: DUF4352 domain-containing protein, partial [Lachnospiraceae bacterium]|nr:DUF4352 domain-containing protein [Lachnospiraceae bacterium]